MAFTLATWNINSVRLRESLVLKLATDELPDVLCLQECKSPVELIPVENLKALGYTHMVARGQKGYNGVAIFSKMPLREVGGYDLVQLGHARHVAAELPNGVTIHNFYVPAGGDIPDPAVNDKFAHKLAFVDEMTKWFRKECDPDAPVMALGDFNIAPLEHDVWSHKQLLDVVSHTPVEVEKLGKMYASLDWHDAIRHFVPEDQKCYTWWSYRNRDWKKSNRGRRLDHIWVTKPLMPYLKSYNILQAARDWTQPSDHVPVIVDLEI